MTSLGTALPEEIKRVQRVREIYLKFPTGAIAAALMQAEIDLAVQALAEGDVLKKMRCYEALKLWTL